MDIRHLYPRRGDDVLEWWKKVTDWAKTLTVETGPGMFLSQGPNGTQIMVREGSPVRTPLRIGLTGSRATVSPGFVGDRVPFVALPDGSGYIRLDGTGADGVTPATGAVPGIDLSKSKPGPDRRGAIVIRMQVNNRGIPIDDREDPEALQVTYTAEFDAAARRKLAAENIAIEPLAIVYWSAGARPIPERVGQIVRHNLQHSYAAGEPGRHFFSAV